MLLPVPAYLFILARPSPFRDDIVSRILDLIVTEISLVRRPANRRGVILRQQAPHQHQHWFDITRTEPLWQRLYGIVYAPNEVDTQGDWADADTIRAAATEFMRTRRQKHVDREHDFEPLDDTFVAESWLTRAGDPLFPDDPPGTWAVGIQINDAELWAEIEAGEVAGLSLAGLALLNDDDLQKTHRKNFLTGLREIFQRKTQRATDAHDPSDEVDTMTADEVRALVREVIAENQREQVQAQAKAEIQTQLEQLAAKQTEDLIKTMTLEEQVAGLAQQLEELKQQPINPKGQDKVDLGPVTMTRAQFQALTAKDRSTYLINGGILKDRVEA